MNFRKSNFVRFPPSFKDRQCCIILIWQLLCWESFWLQCLFRPQDKDFCGGDCMCASFNSLIMFWTCYYKPLLPQNSKGLHSDVTSCAAGTSHHTRPHLQEGHHNPQLCTPPQNSTQDQPLFWAKMSNHQTTKHFFVWRYLIYRYFTRTDYLNPCPQMNMLSNARTLNQQSSIKFWWIIFRFMSPTLLHCLKLIFGCSQGIYWLSLLQFFKFHKWWKGKSVYISFLWPSV